MRHLCLIFCFFSCIFLATKHQNPLRPKPSNQQTHPMTHHWTQLTTTSTTTNHYHHGGMRQKERNPSRERPIKREKFIWVKERVKHRSLRERHQFEWERERERETDLREKKDETFGFDFEQNWEIERADWWVMNEEQRW